MWINLGSADALRRQITFSVFDADKQDPAKTDRKGSIEVTKILGDHMAEAHITNDDPQNPILTGDQILQPGLASRQALRFALTGIIDLDGDGRSDMKMARDLIELNGGDGGRVSRRRRHGRRRDHRQHAVSRARHLSPGRQSSDAAIRLEDDE